MENSTAESVLEKTFSYLDKIIQEKNQDDTSAENKPFESENSEERMAGKSGETVEQKG